jgi:YbbR domain-containing protein
MVLSAFPELLDITHTFSNTATPSNTNALTISPYIISLKNTGANVYIDSSSVKITNSTANVTVNTSGITYANSTVTFTFKPPTAAQVTAGNYFLAANGTWTLLTVP